ncbi:unnamed protein product [Camellia sinensis]
MDTWNEMIWLEEQLPVRAEHTTMVGGATQSNAKDTSYEEGRDVKRGHVSSFWALLVFFAWARIFQIRNRWNRRGTGPNRTTNVKKDGYLLR